MDQFAQTNDLQQAIDNVANGAGAGMPPMPPSDEVSPIAPVDPMPIAPPPVPGNNPSMPEVQPLVPPEDGISGGNTQTSEDTEVTPIPVTITQEPSAEQILSESLKTEPAMPAENVSETATQDGAGSQGAELVDGDLESVKVNILNDLLPLMDKVESTPEEKFEIYKDALSTLHDKNIISDAYKVATKISDENKKAEALIGLMKAIDEVK